MLASGTWCAGFFRLDGDPGPYLMLRVDDFIETVKEAPLAVAFSFCKTSAGALFAISARVDSEALGADLRGKFPQFPPLKYPVAEWIAILDSKYDVDLIDDALSRDRIHIVLARNSGSSETVYSDSGQMKLTLPQATCDIVVPLDPAIASCLRAEWNALLGQHDSIPNSNLSFSQAQRELARALPFDKDPILPRPAAPEQPERAREPPFPLRNTSVTSIETPALEQPASRAVARYAGATSIETPASSLSTAALAATTRWDVKFGDSSIRRYSEKNAIVDAIMAGEIKPDWECRQVTVRPKNGKPSQSKWRTIERSFDVYRPISRLMWKGGSIGMSIGLMIAFALRILDTTAAALMVGDPRLSGMALMSVFLFLDSLGPLVGEISPATKDGVTFVAAILLRCLFLIGIWLVAFKGLYVLLGLILGLGGLGGILIIGGLFGGLPGLAIGTVVGLARRRSFPLPPGASPQSSGRMVSLGVLVPLACLAVGSFLFVEYLLPFGAKATIELLNSPLFR
jgi:hypothetical protein